MEYRRKQRLEETSALESFKEHEGSVANRDICDAHLLPFLSPVLAPMDKICDLADEFDALVMVDECHATGFLGKTGRGGL